MVLGTAVEWFAGKILEKASAGQYKIDPVIRHGIPVEKKFVKKEEEAAQYTADLIQKIKEQGYDITNTAEIVRAIYTNSPRCD